MKPIEIVGGGLAGLALGRALLRQSVPVEVHEALDYPRHRVCGEFICGLRESTVQELELGALLADGPRHRSIMWHWRGRRVGENMLPTAAVGLSRYALDHRLAESFVRGGGRLRVGRRIDPSATPPGWVWTTGRRPGDGKWLGLKTHCRGLETSADLEFHFGDGGYVGASAVEGGAVNVCGLFRRRADVRAPAPEVLLAYLRACGLDDLAERVRATMVPGAQAAVAAVNFDRHPPPDRLVLGDAFAMIPPFTGDGMAMAFEGAEMAVAPLVGFSRGDLSWAEATAAVRRGLRRSFGARLRVACVLQRFLLGAKGQACLALAARAGFLPFRPLFQWLH